MTDYKKWVFIISTIDKPGAVTATTSMFSGRGLQIDMLMAYGEDHVLVEGNPAAFLVQFSAFQERKEYMRRRLSRLQIITSVLDFEYNDPYLIKSVTFVLSEAVSMLPDGVIKLNERLAIYTGSATESDKIIREMLTNKLAKTYSYHMLNVKGK